jgi:hypothetical protein
MWITYLGHAMWLAEMGELRILFDPLLDGVHHGGVFEIHPARRIDVAALAADFIVVSHRHPDHFDVRSLARLAEHDAQSVVLTSDALVAETARKLGFESAHVVDTLAKVELSSGALLTTPSFGTETEWGILLTADGTTLWNQVDSVARNVEDIGSIRDAARRALDAPDLVFDLVLARWQPLLEIQALLGERPGFPLATYSELLDQIAAMEAYAIVPGSAGSRHRDAYAFMNRLVYPLSERRFLADVRARVPGTRALGTVMGGRYRVESRRVELEREKSTLVELEKSRPDDRIFRPFELPPIFDPDDRDRDASAMRSRIEGFVKGELLPAVGRELAAIAKRRSLSLVLEVVSDTTTDAYTIRVGPNGTELERDFDPDYDVLNSIAASQLFEVLEGRRHWGEPLLGGFLRSSMRAYDVDETGLRKLRVAPIFLYYALPYEKSVERVTDWLTRSGRA